MKKSLTKVKCELCGAEVHFIEAHLRQEHPEVSISEYVNKFPEAEIMSESAMARLKELGRLADNKHITANLDKLFKLNPFNSDEHGVVMFEVPHNNTPKIESDYIFNKENLAFCLYMMMNKNNPMLLTGPTGSGKSSIITQVAARLNWPYYRINCDADITRADFVGQWVLQGKEMVFQYGILPNAMREGALLVVDEWDTANPAIGMALQAVLEDDGKLTIAETGEVITPSAGFRIACTSNTLGMGDETGLYNGTQPQNFASLDRFKIVLEVDYPSKDAEVNIIKKKVGITDGDILRKLVEYARLIREAFKREEIRVTMSTRTILNIADKIVDFGDVASAYKVAYINKCSGSDKKFATELLQRVWAV